MYKKELHLGRCLDDLKKQFDNLDKAQVMNRPLARYFFAKKYSEIG